MVSNASHHQWRGVSSVEAAVFSCCM